MPPVTVGGDAPSGSSAPPDLSDDRQRDSGSGVLADQALTQTYSGDPTASVSGFRFGEGRIPFDKYCLIEKLGQGGMGAVFRAEQPELRREVAIKIVLGGALATEEQVQRFRAEAQAAAGFQHPGIVSIHDVGFADGMHFFTMDLLAGGTLAERLHGHEYAGAEAAQMVAQIARAADYLHKRGMIHRDLKPSNVMFGEDDRPCLTDFGLVKLLEDESGCTRTGDVLGTASCPLKTPSRRQPR